MTHTPENSPQSTLGRALGLGAVAGVRSMSAPALLSRAASRGNIEGIEFVRFDEKDVVRHQLVQQIVKAYDAYGSGSRQ